jgi:predicted DsbA family dithiol-disulfide isomerase
LFAGRNVDLPAMMDHLRSVAAQLNLEFGNRVHTYNSRMAQELGKWAESQGRGHAYHLAVFRAYFADGLNIGDTDILLSVCSDLGLDKAEAREVIDARTFQKSVDLDWQRSRNLRITAVPTFRLGSFNLVGAQPYQKLADMLVRHDVPQRAGRQRKD